MRIPAEEREHCIRTFTGRLPDLQAPLPMDIDIRDIAHALAQINRFTGHTQRPYTVAEHSVLCSLCVAPQFALEALLHDAAEAYLGDVASPLKSLLPQYAVLEERWLVAISLRFDVQLSPMKQAVKRIDAAALEAEFATVMERDEWLHSTGLKLPGDPPDAANMRWHIAQGAGRTDWNRVYLHRFHELMAGRELARIEKCLKAM